MYNILSEEEIVILENATRSLNRTAFLTVDEVLNLCYTARLEKSRATRREKEIVGLMVENDMLRIVATKLCDVIEELVSAYSVCLRLKEAAYDVIKESTRRNKILNWTLNIVKEDNRALRDRWDRFMNPFRSNSTTTTVIL